MRYESNDLWHYGIPKMHWGQRRFQNADGTLTPEGRERYRKKDSGDSLLKKAENLGRDSRKKGPTSQGPSPDGHTYRKKDSGNSVLDKIENLGRNSRKGGLARGMGKTAGGVYDKDDGSKDMERLQKDAKKDAEDMARAKAYYGEGAGNRRKQIKNRISERMKDPDYKAEYEKQLAAQDMSKHQKAANRERKVEDAKNSAKKVGRGLKNLLLGFGSASMTAVAIYSIAKMTGADKKIAEYGKKAIKDVISKAKGMKKPSVKDYNWHSNDGARASSNRPNHSTQRRPWIDDQGGIHVK